MSIGRPLTFDPDKALQSAIEVFWCKDYESSSLRDLLQAMALSKSSLLFARCFMHYCSWGAGRMRARLAHSASGCAFTEETFNAVAEGADTRGCLLMNTASEFGQRDPVMAQLLAAGVERFTEVFREAIVRAQTQGTIPTARDPYALAQYLVGSMSGLRTMVKAGIGLALAREVVQGILRGLA
jgi:TetR/AcrR family transcriptional repressor of nem operon